MSLLGVDIGTTGCKASTFSEDGRLLSQAYREYDILRQLPGLQELDSENLWRLAREAMAEAARGAAGDPVKALAVSSFGEAMTPVTGDRRILRRCILGYDERGQEYVDPFAARVGRRHFYACNGNVLGHVYSMPKLQWLRDHEKRIYDETYKFLLPADLIYYMLGCEPRTDYSLANRTLLFDIRRKEWSDELVVAAGLDREKLPDPVPSGSELGVVDAKIAAELGLTPGVKVIAGGHDQCCNALGAGIVAPRKAAYSMGTVGCITPIYDSPPDLDRMLENGMNIEDHVIPGLYASFLYNSGGSVLKWFRDSFARLEKERAEAAGADVYDLLLSEMPAAPTRLMVLPHFTATGPPLFETRTSGAIAGLGLDTARGEFVKGLLEGVTYYFREGLEFMERAGIEIDEYRPTGGGAKSPGWLQLTADILGKPLTKTEVSEAGALGAAVLAGVGCGAFDSVAGAVERLVKIERIYLPDAGRHARYDERMALYRRFYPELKQFLADLSGMENDGATRNKP